MARLPEVGLGRFALCVDEWEAEDSQALSRRLNNRRISMVEVDQCESDAKPLGARGITS